MMAIINGLLKHVGYLAPDDDTVTDRSHLFQSGQSY